MSEWASAGATQTDLRIAAETTLMNRPPIDLRSDTVTRPTPAMRRAMAEAEVGDDVFGDDPTVHALEARTAELLGKEAAVFVPSGTMANQIAVGVHTRPGDELLCATTSHVYVWEAGGIARLSGVTARTFEGDFGLLSLDEIKDAIRPDDIHYVRTRLVWLENTHNRGGGRIHPIEGIAAIRQWARENRLAIHLDGARLMNAVVATGRPCGNGHSTSTPSRSASRRVWGHRSARRWRDRPRPSGRPGGSARSSAAGCGRLESSPRQRSVRPGAQRRAAGRGPRRRPGACRGLRGHRGLRARIGTGRDQSGLGPASTTLGTAAEVVAYLRSRGILVALRWGPR